MKYYPINLNIKNRNCLIVGAGSVGARKANVLLRCKAFVTAVSLEFAPEFKSLEKQGITIIKKKYSQDLLENMFLVVGATDNKELNHEISRHAKQLKVLCNIADNPEKSDFTLPSIVDRDDLLITVSTNGKSPALAKKIKAALEVEFGKEYADFLHIMGKIRKKLLLEKHAPLEHRVIFNKLINSELLETIKNKNFKKTDHILSQIVGRNYTCENLLSGDAQ